MRSSQWLPVGTALFLSTFLVACASVGPDLNGPEGPSLMAAYSGIWTLVPEESEDLNRKLFNSVEDAAAGRGGGGTSGRRGGMSGGMAGGGGRRGGGGQMDPEEMRRSMEVIRRMAEVPRRLILDLEPEAVTLTEGGSGALVLPLGAGREDILQDGVTLFGSAKWTEKGIEISRELRQGGGVRDKISINEAGDLILVREIDLMGRGVDGTLVYRRNE